VSDVDSLKPANFSITDWRVISWKSADEVYSVSGIQNLPGYQYSFTAQRQFYFFLVQIILPMSLILGMSWIVFWLDHNQPGPRISISITAMLTLVAYRLMLGNFIPRLAYLTRMDYFVFLCTFLVFLSLVSVVVISRLVIQQKETIATKLDKSCRWVFPSLFAVVLIVCFVL
jgi:hypothetical protein